MNAKLHALIRPAGDIPSGIKSPPAIGIDEIVGRPVRGYSRITIHCESGEISKEADEPSPSNRGPASLRGSAEPSNSTTNSSKYSYRSPTLYNTRAESGVNTGSQRRPSASLVSCCSAIGVAMRSNCPASGVQPVITTALESGDMTRGAPP